jgi:hypothetical protein
MARWSSKEVHKLHELYHDTPKKKLLNEFPDRSWRSIVRKAQREKLKRKRLNENEDVWTKNEVPSWFNGEMISDGCIAPDGRYTHTTSKKEYGAFLKEKFLSHDISTKITENSYTDNRTGNEYQRWIVRTKSIFKNLRKLWYPKGKKTVPKDFKVDSNCFFHWILGDGHIKNKTLMLCTEGFSDDSLKILSDSLKLTNIDVNIRKSGNLYIKKTNKNKETVNNFLLGNNKKFPSCYQYKKDRLVSWLER